MSRRTQRTLGEPYWVHVTPRSSNRKTGPILVTTTSRNTCPSTCAFKGHGCYAEYGKLRLHWDKVSQRLRGMSWTDFLKYIESLTPGTLWRHNQAGDLPGDGVNIDAKALGSLVRASRNTKGFTYTHYNVTENTVNRKLIESANKHGFTVNVSANSLEHADEICDVVHKENSTIPVTCVIPRDRTGNYRIRTPKGRKVVVCPATYRDTSCAKCRLCQVRSVNGQPRVIIGFPAHGPGAKKAEAPRVQGEKP